MYSFISLFLSFLAIIAMHIILLDYVKIKKETISITKKASIVHIALNKVIIKQKEIKKVEPIREKISKKIEVIKQKKHQELLTKKIKIVKEAKRVIKKKIINKEKIALKNPKKKSKKTVKKTVKKIVKKPINKPNDIEKKVVQKEQKQLIQSITKKIISKDINKIVVSDDAKKVVENKYLSKIKLKIEK